ncbi:MAG: hypothetical protein IJP70_11295 [Bacteroidales bacterium]|nr:hypothetical protein [Bacteroidales bacterium]
MKRKVLTLGLALSLSSLFGNTVTDTVARSERLQNFSAVSPVDLESLNNHLFMPPVYLQPGGEATASIMMNNVSDICGLQFEIKLPEGITIPLDEDDYYYVELSTRRTTVRKHNIFEVTKLTNGNIQVICSSTANAVFKNNSGEVVTLTLVADAGLAEGPYEVQLVDVRLSDTDAKVDHVGDVTAYVIVGQYKRDVSSDWGTVVLPYDTRSTDAVQLYALAGADLTAGVLTVEAIDNLAANTPGLFLRLNKAETVAFPMVSEGESSEIIVSASTAVNGWNSYGCYYNKVFNPQDTDHIYYIAEDKFWFANQSFEVGTFHCWFEAPSAANIGSFRIVMGEDNITDLQILEAGQSSQPIYDLQGRKLKEVYNRNPYIVDGKIKVEK